MDFLGGYVGSQEGKHQIPKVMMMKKAMSFFFKNPIFGHEKHTKKTLFLKGHPPSQKGHGAQNYREI